MANETSNLTETVTTDTEYKYIIDTLRTKNKETGQNYYVYPVTKEKAVTDSDGTALDVKLTNMQNQINSINENTTHSPIIASVPVSNWVANGDIWTNTIDGLELNTEADYEIAFNHQNLADDVYLALASCFIVPSAYTETTMTLKALSELPESDFEILIIRR